MDETKKLKGRDLITIGIFSALYFILNFAAMITGFVPMLWLLYRQYSAALIFSTAAVHTNRCRFT